MEDEEEYKAERQALAKDRATSKKYDEWRGQMGARVNAVPLSNAEQAQREMLLDKLLRDGGMYGQQNRPLEPAKVLAAHPIV